MKRLAENKAIEKVNRLKRDYAEHVRSEYEHRAKSCLTCTTPGACCLDAHFVNVHITRLEAAAIRQVLAELSNEKQSEVLARTSKTITKYNLSAGKDSFSRTYACPLFEPASGCLVHEKGKPLPCIQHACYESKSDLPPDELLTEMEEIVTKLNERVYGSAQWLPLPVAILNGR